MSPRFVKMGLEEMERGRNLRLAEEELSRRQEQRRRLIKMVMDIYRRGENRQKNKKKMTIKEKEMTMAEEELLRAELEDNQQAEEELKMYIRDLEEQQEEEETATGEVEEQINWQEEGKKPESDHPDHAMVKQKAEHLDSAGNIRIIMEDEAELDKGGVKGHNRLEGVAEVEARQGRGRGEAEAEFKKVMIKKKRKEDEEKCLTMSKELGRDSFKVNRRPEGITTMEKKKAERAKEAKEQKNQEVELRPHEEVQQEQEQDTVHKNELTKPVTMPEEIATGRRVFSAEGDTVKLDKLMEDEKLSVDIIKDTAKIKEDKDGFVEDERLHEDIDEAIGFKIVMEEEAKDAAKKKVTGVEEEEKMDDLVHTQGTANKN